MTLRIADPHSWFTSSRERWLWAAALLVTIAIALTLVIGPVLAELTRFQSVLDAAFALALLLVGATVIALATDMRPRGLEVGIALAAVAIFLLLVARVGLAERTHLIEYAALAALIHAALEERATHGRRVRSPALAAIAITTLIGVLDECLQAVIPGRVFDPLDIVFNTTAAVTAVTLGVFVRWASGRWMSRTR